MIISLSYFKIMIAMLNLGSVYWGLSSVSLLSFWMSMELNMITFILILSMTSEYSKASSSLIYFLVQSLMSSAIILMIILFSYVSNFFFSVFLLGLSLMVKMGLAPFHSWFLRICSSVNYQVFFLLNVVQKVLPLYLSSIFYSSLVGGLTFLSLVLCILEVLTRNKIILIMGLSSIFNLSWIILCSHFLLKMFFLCVYSVILTSMLSLMESTKINFIDCSIWPGVVFSGLYLLMVLSLMGVPPMFTFVVKVFLLKDLLLSGHFIFSFMLVMGSFVFLSVYMKFFIQFYMGKSFNLSVGKSMEINYLMVLLLIFFSVIIF